MCPWNVTVTVFRLQLRPDLEYANNAAPIWHPHKTHTHRLPFEQISFFSMAFLGHEKKQKQHYMTIRYSVIQQCKYNTNQNEKSDCHCKIPTLLANIEGVDRGVGIPHLPLTPLCSPFSPTSLPLSPTSLPPYPHFPPPSKLFPPLNKNF